METKLIENERDRKSRSAPAVISTFYLEKPLEIPLEILLRFFDVQLFRLDFENSLLTFRARPYELLLNRVKTAS